MKGKFTSTISSLAGKCVLIVMLVAVLMAANAGRAAELTIAEGGITNERIPVEGVACSYFTMSSFIYPSTMLDALKSEQITKMSFYARYGYDNISWGNASFEVYMAEVEGTAFERAEAISTDGMTLVYSGSLCVKDGLMLIPLNVPYIYGGGNLQVYVKQTVSGPGEECLFYGNNGKEATSASLGGRLSFDFYEIHDFMPTVTFSYGGIASPQSLAASEITASGAKLTWTAGVEGMTWNLRYKKDGDTEYAEVDGLQSNEYEFTELTDGTKYIVEVQAVLGEEESEWSTIEFTTICNVVIVSPQSLAVSEITASGAKLTWTAGVEGMTWNLRYKKDGDTEYAEVDGLQSNEYEFTELTDGTKYIVEVQAVLGEEESEWSTTEFTTNVTAENAPVLTIAEGTDTNNSVPVAGHYDYNMSFFIYPAEMLSSLNGSQVNSMTFYAAEGYENISWGDSEFKVYLQDTEKTGYTSDETPVNNNSGLVYSGTLCIVNGKMIVSFDTPYVYRGENIQVIMSGNLTSTTNCVFKGIEEQGSAICLYADGTNGGQKLQNFLPKVTFGYSIASPQSLIVSEITASGAKLEWTAGKENMLWNIRYKKDGDTEYIEVNGLKNNEYEFTELTDGAKYIVEVQALLGEEESAWSLIEFTTKVKTAPGLTIAEGTVTNNKVPVAGLAYINKSCFIYPAEMLSVLNCAQINSMTFYAAEGYENISWGDSEFNVYLQETEKTGYTSDENPFDDNSGLVYSGNLNILNGKMIVSFDSPYVYNGGNMQVYVYSYINSETICCFYGIEKHEGAIFRYENAYNFGQELQNFVPKVTFDYVNIPNAVTASEVGETSAVISWTGYAECYNMQYRKVAGDDEQANDWIAVEDEISATSYMLDGLDANTKYEVQVQAVISETETTVWSSSCEFQTQIATGIESIDADDEDDSAIYDLMGRRVNNPASGIYIKGGKKVVVIR